MVPAAGLLVLVQVLAVSAQQAEQCFTGGSIAGTVIATLVVVALLQAAAYLAWKYYWKRRQGKELMLVSGDPEAGLADRQFAFDNPGFLTEDSTLPQTKKIGKNTPADVKAAEAKNVNKEPKHEAQKGSKGGCKWQAWSPLSALVGGSGKHKEARRTLDDSFIGEPERNVVALRGHDFTGLGFNICGNMRDGIFVRDVLHRGPASESGRIAAGDRLVGINISFQHMVFEDALTILSYASPYDVQLEVEKGAPGSVARDTGSGKRSPSVGPADRLCHPFYRSQSIDDLAKMRRSSLSARKAKIKKPSADSPGPVGVVGSPSAGSGRKEEAKSEQSDNPRTSRTSVTMPKPERAKKPAGKPAETPPSSDKHTKFGIRVLPPNIGDVKLGGTPEATQNEHNTKIEKLSPAAPLREPEVIQQVPDKEEEKPSQDVPDNIPTEMPEEMRLAAMAAISHRKSLHVDKAAAMVKPEIPAKPELELSSGGEAEGSDTPRKNTKRKAPPPPVVSATSAGNPESDSDDSDMEMHNKSKGTTIELNSAQITIHQSPKEEESAENSEASRRDRKTASLGDLSRLESEQPMSIPLERAVSLDMADVTAPVAGSDSATGTAKKRKAPGAPDNELDKDESDDDVTAPQSHHFIKKEPRLMDAGMSDTFKRRLKKSSDWGTLEEAILVTSDSQPVSLQSTHSVVLVSEQPTSLQSPFISSSDVVSVQVVTSSSPTPPSSPVSTQLSTPEPAVSVAADSSSSVAELVTSSVEEPPELPSTPMPVAQTSVREFSLASPNTSPISNFHHSMTYISTASPQHHVTEIQVLTGGNVSTAPILTDNAEATTTVRHGTSGGNLLLIPSVTSSLMNGPESLEETLSSFTSTHSELEEESAARVESPTRNNVTVMSINTNGEHNNNESSLEGKSREVLQITPGELDSVMMSHSHYLLSTQSPEPAGASSSTFEQWVFLDNGGVNGHVENDTTTMVVNMPAARQSVTHIVLEADKEAKRTLTTSQTDLSA